MQASTIKKKKKGKHVIHLWWQRGGLCLCSLDLDSTLAHEYGCKISFTIWKKQHNISRHIRLKRCHTDALPLKKKCTELLCLLAAWNRSQRSICGAVWTVSNVVWLDCTTHSYLPGASVIRRYTKRRRSTRCECSFLNAKQVLGDCFA